MRIDLGNGNILENVRMAEGQYVSEDEVTEGTFEGIKKVKITTDDGFEKTIKRAKVEKIHVREGVWKFVLKEMTEEEVKEASKKKTSKRQNEWIKENYERVSLVLPKGTKERITSLGYTVSGFINEAVKVMLEAQE